MSPVLCGPVQYFDTLHILHFLTFLSKSEARSLCTSGPFQALVYLLLRTDTTLGLRIQGWVILKLRTNIENAS